MSDCEPVQGVGSSLATFNHKQREGFVTALVTAAQFHARNAPSWLQGLDGGALSVKTSAATHAVCVRCTSCHDLSTNNYFLNDC